MEHTLRRRSAFGLSLVVASCLVITLSAAQLRTKSAKGSPSPAQSSVQSQLIGSWRLVSRETRKSNGELLADPNLAAAPAGFLVYETSIHVAVQLSRKDR